MLLSTADYLGRKLDQGEVNVDYKSEIHKFYLEKIWSHLYWPRFV